MKPDSGPHLSFPFQVGPDGRMAHVTTLEQHVRDEVIQLVLTNLGERAFLPEFGGDVRRLIFENTDDAMLITLKASINQALSQWLGHRAVVDALDLSLDNSLVNLTLRYHVASTTEPKVIVFQGGSI